MITENIGVFGRECAFGPFFVFAVVRTAALPFDISFSTRREYCVAFSTSPNSR